MKKLIKASLLAATAILIPMSATAVTSTVTANIAFDTPLAITTDTIEAGTVKALTTATYTVSTAGAISTGTPANILYGTTSAADLTISGPVSTTVDISVGSYTANNGVTPSNATCDYDGGGSGTCAISGAAAPAAGKHLLVGADLAADGTQTEGTSAAPTFVITVVYH